MRVIAITKNRLRILLLTLLSFLLLSPFVIRKQQATSVVTITEFSDFQCPYCKRAATVVEQVRKTYGARVKVVFKQMPLPMHQYAFRAAQAAVAAEQQGKFWQYHDRLFAAVLGKKDLGTTEFPPTETPLIDGDVAFRQHSGGHTPGPNWPTFLTFASRYFKAPSARG